MQVCDQAAERRGADGQRAGASGPEATEGASQAEVDYCWERLTEGGDPKAQQCGWLKDKFGLSWQVVPTVLAAMLNDADTAKSQRTMRAMLQMRKLDIAGLGRAFAG